jgi:hypothetical protein
MPAIKLEKPTNFNHSSFHLTSLKLCEGKEGEVASNN